MYYIAHWFLLRTENIKLVATVPCLLFETDDCGLLSRWLSSLDDTLLMVKWSNDQDQLYYLVFFDIDITILRFWQKCKYRFCVTNPWLLLSLVLVLFYYHHYYCHYYYYHYFIAIIIVFKVTNLLQHECQFSEWNLKCCKFVFKSYFVICFSLDIEGKISMPF